jgi:hypothetical protein
MQTIMIALSAWIAASLVFGTGWIAGRRVRS